MSIDWSGFAFPKPSKLARVKASDKADRANEKKLAAMRAIVWARDGGICRNCERRCVRSLTARANRGEVHHLRGRRVAPQDKFNADTAVLLCLECHLKAQRHQITVPK